MNQPNRVTLDGVEYELVPVYTTEVFVYNAGTPFAFTDGEEKEVLQYYGLKPTEVTNQSLS